MKNLHRLSLIFMLLLSSCISDYTEELSGNYFFLDEGAEMKQILSHPPGRTEIYGKVTSYNHDDNFILAMQIPSRENYRDMIAAGLGPGSKNQKELNESRQKADSIMKTDPFYEKLFSNHVNYWIISHTENKTYGPMTVDEYLRARQRLNVPPQLRLK
jgi:hypothetical protein